jgi:hypothetical protein
MAQRHTEGRDYKAVKDFDGHLASYGSEITLSPTKATL